MTLERICEDCGESIPMNRWYAHQLIHAEETDEPAD